MQTIPNFDIENATLGDLMTLEDHGVDLAALQDFDESAPSARVIAAVQFLALRSTNPDATWEDAARTRISDITPIGAADPE